MCNRTVHVILHCYRDRNLIMDLNRLLHMSIMVKTLERNALEQHFHTALKFKGLLIEGLQ